MRQPLASVAIVLAIAWMARAAPSAAAQATEVIDRVMAIVAGEVITLSDVTAARELGLVSVSGAGDPVREVLTKLIDRSLMLDEVERYSPPFPEAHAVDKAVGAVRARFDAEDLYQATLSRVGFSVRHLRELIAEDLRIQTYLAQRFTIPPLADGELARYYELHREEFMRDGRLLPLTDVRDEVVRAATETFRQERIAAWLEGLHRRAEITDLYVTGR